MPECDLRFSHGRRDSYHERTNMFDERTPWTLLPAQYIANGVSLALTGDELQRVTERDQPALTAQRTHLANMIYVDDCVPMHSLELRFLEALLNRAESLSCRKPLLECNNPDHLTLGLERQNVIHVQKEVLPTVPANDLPARQRTGRYRGPYLYDLVRHIQGILLQGLGAFYRLSQSRPADGFQQIVDGSRLECFYGVLVECGNDHNYGQVPAVKLSHNFEAT